MKKKLFLTAILTLICCTLLIAGAAAEDIEPVKPSGAGTETNPYQISSAAELYWFAGLVNGTLSEVQQNRSAWAVLTADITIQTITLDEDGHIVGGTPSYSWTPIGYYGENGENVYAGTIDGQGYTISGLYCTNANNNDVNVGLFGCIGEGGTVKNVKVDDSSFSGSDDFITIGGVCGYNYGTIECCSFSGSVFVYGLAGGVCGANSGTIENCSNSGTSNGGGVCGYNLRGGIIINCSNTGSVTGNAYIGGLCSCNEGGRIENCSNSGTVARNSTDTSQIGGICGYNTNNGDNIGTIINCSNTGEVNGSYIVGEDHGGNTGGVCGYNSNGTVKNCYWLEVTGTGTASSGIGGGKDGEATEKDSEKFASGEVAWLLNGESATGGPWRQNLGEGEDAAPVLDSTHGIVHESSGNYTNAHVYNNGFCSCGVYEPAVQDTDGYYKITNAGNLYWFAEQVNGGKTGINAKLTADITVNTDVLDDDGDLVSDTDKFRTWTPIGRWSYGYTGTFDGAGHTIRGLYCTAENIYASGIFAQINPGGTVKNVNIADSYIGYKCNYYGTDAYIGGLCGLNYGTIENCSFSGRVESETEINDQTTTVYYNDFYIGGLCGRNEGVITGCSNTGSVTDTVNSYIEDISIGGLCGDNLCLITNSFSTGPVTVSFGQDVPTPDGNFAVGGFCGLNSYGGITNCFSTGKVTVSSGQGSFGGFCGKNYDEKSKISNCFWLKGAYDGGIGSGSGDVTEKSNDQFKSGEVDWLLNGESINGPWRQTLGAGGDSLPVPDASHPVVTKSGDTYTNSEHTHSYDNEGFCTVCGAYQPADPVGGYYEITNAGNLYWFAQQVNSGNTGINAVLTTDITVNKDMSAGELRLWTPIGDSSHAYSGTFDGQGHTVSGLSIKDAYAHYAGLFGHVGGLGTVKNVGVVDSSFTSMSSGYAGGICGYNQGTIENSYTSAVLDCIAVPADFYPSNYYACIGGVCGENRGTVTNCFNSGSVTATSSASVSAYIGGVCGWNNGGTITNCYWLEDTVEDDNVGESKSADEFASGEVAWLLNKGQTNGPWRQNLGEGEDEYPVLDATHSEVIRIYIDAAAWYINPGNVILPDTGKTYVDADGNPIDPKTYQFTEGTKIFSRDTVTVRFVYGNGAPDTVEACVIGGTITLPTPTRSGYIFLGWACSDGKTYAGGNEVTVNSALTFTAVWANMPDITPTEPVEPVEPTELPFTDVPASAWYYDAVKTVYEVGLMNGVTDTEFDPDGTLNRAMFWTILARASGVDTDGGATWYAVAQQWAVENGVSDGTDAMGALTREQLVTMLWRLNGEPVVNYLITTPDADQISSWALEAMRWAASTGLIQGDENGCLNPTATCTRAQAATFLVRYLTVE